MKIAIEGCMHGELETVYKTISDFEKSENSKIDLLICCGDFQAVRNKKDLESLNTPVKYKAMNTFWKYYSGKEVAPVPTIFIGGNHEASNYLWELHSTRKKPVKMQVVKLNSFNEKFAFVGIDNISYKLAVPVSCRHGYYGGWAAPNIYFLGFAGVIKFGNIRIGGLSGIYNARNYRLGHFERPPYNESEIRSIYHVREYDVMKLMQVEEPIDIFLSHDWPIGITDCGDLRGLLKWKPYFEKEIEARTLGSMPAAKLLDELKPSYWFSAHLHCKFSALVQHGECGPITKFLALDKCLPGRKFLQIIDIESEPGPYELQFDEEWLSITRALHPAFPLTKRADLRNVQIDKEGCRQWVKNRLQTSAAKPFNFAQTAPCYDSSQSSFNNPTVEHHRNPQTEALLRLLELPYLLDGSAASDRMYDYSAPVSQDFCASDSEDIPIDDVDELEELAATTE